MRLTVVVLREAWSGLAKPQIWLGGFLKSKSDDSQTHLFFLWQQCSGLVSFMLYIYIFFKGFCFMCWMWCSEPLHRAQIFFIFGFTFLVFTPGQHWKEIKFETEYIFTWRKNQFLTIPLPSSWISIPSNEKILNCKWLVKSCSSQQSIRRGSPRKLSSSGGKNNRGDNLCKSHLTEQEMYKNYHKWIQNK